MVIDEELNQFYLWLQAKGDGPSVASALRWIAEFEIDAAEDEEEFRQFKAWLKGQDDPKGLSALRFVTWFEEMVEPDPMLKRLSDWLQAKANDPTAVLVGWWLNEFEDMQKDHPSEVPSPILH